MAFFLVIPFLLRAQDPVTLQFVGRDQNDRYVQLSRVSVENVTKLWQEMLYYPDTTLSIGITGVEEFGQGGQGVRLFQNIPNPFDGVTDFALYLPESMNVQLEIYDLKGGVVAFYKGSFEQGCHQFRACLATPQTYLLNVQTEDGTVRIKMLNAGHAGQNRIEYVGEASYLEKQNSDVNPKAYSSMPFNYGDTMSYIGNARIADRDFTSVPVVKAQYTSDLIPLVFTLPLPTVTTDSVSFISTSAAYLYGSVLENDEYPVISRGFLFADNAQMSDAVAYPAGAGDFHCTVSNLQLFENYYYCAYATSDVGTAYGEPRSFLFRPAFICGIDTMVDYDGNIYHTLQIGHQCWMKENLNTTHFADGTEIPVPSSSFWPESEPYRFDALMNPDAPLDTNMNLAVVGYLYNWAAVMHGDSSTNTNPSGVQGICPTGWHVPSLSEWMQLRSYVSSQSQYVCGGNSANIAKALADSVGWYFENYNNACNPSENPSANNSTGFSAIPVGSTAQISGYYSYFWSTTQNIVNANRCSYVLEINGNAPNVNMVPMLLGYACPVRCLHD